MANERAEGLVNTRIRVADLSGKSTRLEQHTPVGSKNPSWEEGGRGTHVRAHLHAKEACLLKMVALN